MPFESADDTLVATAGHEQSPFEQGVLSAFSAHGALSQAMPGYAPRESQLSMRGQIIRLPRACATARRQGACVYCH
jgi:hypothetical protein